jgi:hypothetical protein
MQRKYIIAAALCLAFSLADAQAEQQTSSDPDYLTSAQQVKVGQFITERYPPLKNVNFSVTIGATVPEAVPLQSFPPEAESIFRSCTRWGSSSSKS